ncbi:hypothetical protein B9Z55_010880 [Caenorhabditis nigoni]|uniref:Uncharacterized protein n=1 Tax=Caenorhabditis nigoni TaxID=1611254 RepID=A0A2G5UHP3_9PELO|nr:hypothetical protein B9Z55_010880 [Caenorhabditis nigoni]
MSIKILFEQIEQSTQHVLSDCELQSVTIRKDEEHGLEEEENSKKKDKKEPILYRNECCGTDVETEDKCVGPSILKVNVATKYEFQKLNATQIHRAINDPKLGEFLVRVYPLLKEELDNSDLFNKL